MKTTIRGIVENTGYDERLPDYESMINTETGKERFWRIVNTSTGSLSDEIYKALVELINLTYVESNMHRKD